LPHVSIITAIYNKEHHIAETIRSVPAQAAPHWEMIVVESGSADKSLEIVRHFSGPRIPTILRNALENLAAVPGELERLAAAARQAAQTDFNPDIIQAQPIQATRRAIATEQQSPA
jgi:glycosyltransferase involved in cell wall biosynthesis